MMVAEVLGYVAGAIVFAVFCAVCTAGMLS